MSTSRMSTSRRSIQPLRTLDAPIQASAAAWCLVLLLVLPGVVRAESARPLAATELFDFWSDPALNLHHFLYRWAEVAPPPGGAEREPSRLSLREVDQKRLTQLSAADQEAWTVALTLYRDHVIDRDLLFDDGLVALRDALVGTRGAAEVPEADRGVLAALERVLPIYRATWWPDHAAANRAWVAALLPAALRHEKLLSSRIAAAYEATWPSAPIRVDVVAYGSWSEAYTTSEPHVTIGSLTPKNAAPWNLEILFHEPSHANALEQPLRAILERAFAARGLEPPRSLWHIVLFATAGEVTRGVYAAEGRLDYLPYAEQNRVFHGREDFEQAWAAIDRHHWLPALRAGRPLSSVVEAIVDELSPSSLEPVKNGQP